jgi:signal transduction histidine kinase
MEVTLDRSPLPWAAAHEIYFIVHEALINAARHAKASAIHAEITSDRDKMRIVVADNGCGFPFHGRHDLAALTKMNLGPVTLRERVASLGGDLTIESCKTSASLEIALPTIKKGA